MVLAFPGNQFNGAILPALADLVGSGTIRLLDLMFVFKDARVRSGRWRSREIMPSTAQCPWRISRQSGSWTPRTSQKVAADLAAEQLSRADLLGELVGGTVPGCG